MCIQCTLHLDETQMLQNFLWTKKAVQKIPTFFSWELQLITVLL